MSRRQKILRSVGLTAVLFGLRYLTRRELSVADAFLIGELLALPFEIRELLRLRSGYLKERRAGGSRRTSLVEGAVAAMPPGLRELARFELGVHRGTFRLLRWRSVRGTMGDRMSYGRGERALFAVFGVLGALEGIAVLIAFHSDLLAWAIFGAHEYGVYWLLGMTSSYTCYPHTVDDKAVSIRGGPGFELAVPLDQIAGVSWSFSAKQAGSYAESVFVLPVSGSTEVLLRLTRPLELPATKLQPARSVSEVRFAADSKQAVDTIRARLAA